MDYFYCSTALLLHSKKVQDSNSARGRLHALSVSAWVLSGPPSRHPVTRVRLIGDCKLLIVVCLFVLALRLDWKPSQGVPHLSPTTAGIGSSFPMALNGTSGSEWKGLMAHLKFVIEHLNDSKKAQVKVLFQVKPKSRSLVST